MGPVHQNKKRKTEKIFKINGHKSSQIVVDEYLVTVVIWDYELARAQEHAFYSYRLAIEW